MSDEARGELKKVNMEDVKFGPIRHESLPDDMLETIDYIYKSVGRFVKNTKEQFELDFMYDMHPDREVFIWYRIAKSWELYQEKFVIGKKLSDEQSGKLVAALIGISMGVTDHKQLQVTKTVGQGLAKCWWDVFEQIKDEQLRAQ